jgi:hypothetical protein
VARATASSASGAMVPLERIEEFVDGALYSVWEVEPV